METQESKQTSPWIGIWTHPRQTIRALIDRCPKQHILWLAALNGVIVGLTWVRSLFIRDPASLEKSPALIITLLIIIGALLGIFHLYFGAWLYRVTGKWVGGKGNFTDVKCATGWSCYPFIIVGLFNLLTTYLVGYPLLEIIVGFVYLALLVWSLIIFFKLIGEAHLISAWRAVAALLIAFCLIFVAFMLLFLLIPLLQPLFGVVA